jgi:hypothetical protein
MVRLCSCGFATDDYDWLACHRFPGDGPVLVVVLEVGVEVPGEVALVGPGLRAWPGRRT